MLVALMRCFEGHFQQGILGPEPESQGILGPEPEHQCPKQLTAPWLQPTAPTTTLVATNCPN